MAAIGTCWKNTDDTTVKLCDNLFVVCGHVTCQWTDTN
jgi:hypothetical protein